MYIDKLVFIVHFGSLGVAQGDIHIYIYSLYYLRTLTAVNQRETDSINGIFFKIQILYYRYCRMC